MVHHPVDKAFPPDRAFIFFQSDKMNLRMGNKPRMREETELWLEIIVVSERGTFTDADTLSKQI